jgi:hypothetical protein
MTTNIEQNVVEKFLMDAMSIGNMNGNSDFAKDLLKECRSSEFSSSRGTMR